MLVRYDDRILLQEMIKKKALRFMLGKEEYNHDQGRVKLSVNLNTGKG